jgi:signal transduction histidine kinase
MLLNARRLIQESGSRPSILLALEDITERKRAEEQLQNYTKHLRRLSQRLLEVQEEERRFLARELHDEIGRVLSAVKAYLQRARKLMTEGPVAERMDEGIAHINIAIEQVRNTSLDLHPSMLDDFGLLAALRWYVERQAQWSGTAIDLLAPAELPRLAPSIEAALFRVVQEALTNVLRHAQASHAVVELQLEGGQLSLKVRDNGQGFDPDAVDRQNHVGLSSMKERMDLIGASFELRSAPGTGTEIRVMLPIG